MHWAMSDMMNLSCLGAEAGALICTCCKSLAKVFQATFEALFAQHRDIRDATLLIPVPSVVLRISVVSVRRSEIFSARENDE
jgi:hypothetical protein